MPLEIVMLLIVHYLRIDLEKTQQVIEKGAALSI